MSRAYARNGLNQYTSAGPASFGYDANGNLTSDGTTAYAYDIENRLTSATNGAQLEYDPTGRLWRTTGTSFGTTQFLYDGDALVAEYDGAGNMLKRYVHGDADDDPQVQYTGSSVSSPTYLFADQQGSVVALADEHGFGTAVNSYDAYGTPAAGNTGRFQYTGEAWMPELGLYYYKARFYSPALNRFLQVDPVGYADQVNLYAYVGNDPVNRRDPTGLLGQPGGQEGVEREDENRGLLEEIIDPAAPIREAQYQRLETELRTISPGTPPGLRNPGPASQTALNSVRAQVREAALYRAGRLEAGARTRERNAADHDARAAAFARNPTVRPGMEGRNPAEVSNQQRNRVAHLRQEAVDYRQQAAAARAEAERLRARARELE